MRDGVTRIEARDGLAIVTRLSFILIPIRTDLPFRKMIQRRSFCASPTSSIADSLSGGERGSLYETLAP
jgi:hypothetical protein